MRAAVCRAFGEPLSIEELQLGAPQAGEVEVRIKAAAICHSDILYADGAWGGDLPAVFGHEAAGIVTAVGAGVAQVRPGQHVAVTLVRSCGRCGCCEQGFYGSCEGSFALDGRAVLRDGDGNTVHQGLRTAAFAERVVVDASQVVAIPEALPMASAAILSCGVITGFGAVINTAAIKPGASVAVIGTGGVGLNAIQGAHLSGARAVIALDIAQSKLDAALRFGATDAVNVDAAKTDEGEVAAAVKRAAGGRLVDYVFVTVGAKSAFELAMHLIGNGGVVVLVGMAPLGVTMEFDPLTLANSSQRILGSKMGSSNIQKDIPNLATLYTQGRLKLDELVTACYPLAEINDAIAAVKRGDALRKVVVFEG